jgi:hypothetical protein
MLRFTSLVLFAFLIQISHVNAQEIAGHWQDADGAAIILTEEGAAKIENVNGVYYGKWTTENGQLTLQLFSEVEPYTFAISEFFADLTYYGEGHIPESELAIYRNGYQLSAVRPMEDTEPAGAVSLDAQWIVSPKRQAGPHVGTWVMADGAQLDLSEWGAFRVFTAQNGASFGLFEIEGDILRLQFLFQTNTYEYEVSTLWEAQRTGASTLTPEEFQQAEQNMFNLLSSQVQSTNQMMTQMSSQMMEQMHQTTMKLLINLSGYDWIYERDKKN